jgi:hypothetical protein
LAERIEQQQNPSDNDLRRDHLEARISLWQSIPSGLAGC